MYLTDVVGDTLFLKPVTQAEIIKLVNNTKSKKSKDHDDIDMCLVKKIIPYLVIPLEHIFNISLQMGVFPEGMKIARIIPILKNGNINDFTNYRPISLLSQFSKILEKIFHNRMMSFIEEKNILYESQYGFRKNMSTSLAILELVENITTSIDDRKSTVGIFIDLKNAFDTVDHILIKKLEEVLLISGSVVILWTEANICVLMTQVLNVWRLPVGFRKDPYWVLHCLFYILMICVMYQC